MLLLTVHCLKTFSTIIYFILTLFLKLFLTICLVKFHICYIFLPDSLSGLKAGDEILLLNGKEASALQKDDMMSAFTNQTLTLSISTLPQLDPRMVCSCPPRRSDVEQNLATDIFSQSQGKVFLSQKIWGSVEKAVCF